MVSRTSRACRAGYLLCTLAQQPPDLHLGWSTHVGTQPLICRQVDQASCCAPPSARRTEEKGVSEVDAYGRKNRSACFEVVCRLVLFICSYCVLLVCLYVSLAGRLGQHLAKSNPDKPSSFRVSFALPCSSSEGPTWMGDKNHFHNPHPPPSPLSPYLPGRVSRHHDKGRYLCACECTGKRSQAFFFSSWSCTVPIQCHLPPLAPCNNRKVYARSNGKSPRNQRDHNSP